MPCEGDGERSDREEVSPPRKVSRSPGSSDDGLRVSFFFFSFSLPKPGDRQQPGKKTDVETSPFPVVKSNVKKRKSSIELRSLWFFGVVFFFLRACEKETAFESYNVRIHLICNPIG